MNKILDNHMVRTMSYGVAAIFLVVHIAMYLLFRAYHVVPMAHFNVCSICFYLAMFYVAHKEWWRTYVVGVYLEVLLHMTAAVYFVGLDSDFQVTLVGMNILVFYAEYVGRSLRVRYVYAIPLALMGMCTYLGISALRSYVPAPYVLPNNVEIYLRLGWGAIVFVINIIFLQIFVLLTFHSEKLLSNQVFHDKLTGLANRYYMADYLSNNLKEDSLSDYWIAMADIDNFKHINDTYGHNCGDEVLVGLAAILRDGLDDVQLCRWGGEEFLMMGDAKDGRDPVQLLNRVRATVQNHGFWYGEQRLRATITIGLAYRHESESIGEWINRADEQLYRGKRAGKNRVVA